MKTLRHALMGKRSRALTPVILSVLGMALLGIDAPSGCRSADPARSALPARAPAVVGGEIHGVIAALVMDGNDERRIVLPDVQIHARNTATGVNGPNVMSALNGWFQIPPVTPGTYQVCWAITGFAAGCSSTTVTVGSVTAYSPTILISPLNRVAFGKVLLEGDDNPNRIDRFLTTTLQAHVRGVNAFGVPVTAPVRTNVGGEYVLGGAPPTATKVNGWCEGANINGTFNTPYMKVDLTLPNRSPTIKQLVATAGGTAVRKAAPGTTVSVTATASDPNGHPMTYKWGVSGTSGTFTSVNSPTVSWQLPNSAGVHTIYVLVKDAFGGSTTSRLHISTRGDEARFTGRVIDKDTSAPIGGAVVKVNGVASTTAPNGTFTVVLASSSPRYVLNINKLGYQLYSRPLTEESKGHVYKLVSAWQTSINPTIGNTVTEVRPGQESGAVLQLGANSLVDQNGQLPTGNLNVFIASVDLEDADGRMPGDMGATNAANQEVWLETYGAVDIRIRDTAGNPYNLAPGRTAVLQMPILAASLSSAPATAPLWYYNENTGLYKEEGMFTKVGSLYQATVSHFSVLNVDVEKTDPACMRVHVDEAVLTLPIDIQITVPTGTGVDSVFTRTLEDPLNAIIRLPSSTVITLEVLDSDGNVISSATENVDSGGVIAGPDSPPYPYDACLSDAYLTMEVPTDGGFLDYVGLDDDTTATDYYNIIDPSGTKTTLAAWKTENGFDAGEDADAVYFNAGDLGFGRWMHMKQTGSDIAYYVSNYTTVDDVVAAKQAGDESLGLIATVAMEYTAHPSGGSRYTKFYVYNSSGDRVTFADLDGRGAKYVPRLCITCHGGNYTTPDATNQGNFDSRFIPFALETYEYSAAEYPASSGIYPYTQSYQESEFRLLNEGILSTNYSDAEQEVLCGWYGGGTGCTTLPAVVQDTTFVPDAWITPVDKSSLYSNVVQPSCRACHMTREAPIDWAAWDLTTADPYDGLKEYGATIYDYVCNYMIMPQAKLTYENFWLSTSPHQPASLGAGGLDGWSSTDPCPIP